jgi:hypothetical protein
VLAVDAVRAGMDSARETLARFWGTLAVLVGLFSVVLSFDDPLASRGPGLRSVDLSISLGDYNLVGGLVLAAVGVLLLIASRPTALVAGLLAAVAGLSLHAQLGFSDPLLGGTTTSAAFLFAAGLVAAVVFARSGHPDPVMKDSAQQAAE